VPHPADISSFVFLLIYQPKTYKKKWYSSHAQELYLGVAWLDLSQVTNSSLCIYFFFPILLLPCLLGLDNDLVCIINLIESIMIISWLVTGCRTLIVNDIKKSLKCCFSQTWPLPHQIPKCKTFLIKYTVRSKSLSLIFLKIEDTYFFVYSK